MINLDVLQGALFSSLQVGLASWFCLAHLTRREDFAARSLVALTTLVALALLDPFKGEALGPATSRLAFFAAVLSVCVVLGVFLCRISLWTSIFCCAVGCTVQNLASSLAKLPYRLLTPAMTALGIEGQFSLFGNVVFLVVLLACNALLFKQLESFEHGIENDRRMLAVYGAVVVLGIGLSALLAHVDDLLGPAEPTSMMLRVCHVIVCGFLLFVEWEIAVNRRLEQDVALSARLAHERERQMELSRETIEAINLKCHDMRHQIRTLAREGGVVDQGVIDDMEHQIRLYDSSVRTGNDALDTILTEKCLYCEKHGITLSCIADGRALDFVEPTDLYSFFGNALDNAIEAVERLDDPERRSIGLVVRRTGDMVSVHVENYFDGQVSFGGEGLPQTRKADEANHGFGTRSMRMIVEGLGGSLACKVQGDVFHLDALLPVPA